MNSYYVTVVVQWLASVHSKCKDDWFKSSLSRKM